MVAYALYHVLANWLALGNAGMPVPEAGLEGGGMYWVNEGIIIVLLGK